MAFSTKLSVATHMLALIAIFENEEVTSEAMAASIQTNPVVVRKLLSQLNKEGLIETSRGSGKTKLATLAQDISLYDIYQAVEKKQDVFKIHQDTNPACIVGGNIQTVLSKTMNDVERHVQQALETVSLQDIVTDIERVDNTKRGK